MKVLHVCEVAKGGVSTVINLFARFDSSVVKSHVVVPEQHSRYIDKRLELVEFDRPRRGLRSTARMVRAAHRAASELKPDILICHSSFSLAVVAWFRARLYNVPIVFMPHGLAACRYMEGSVQQAVVRFVEGWLIGLADVAVHGSEYERSLSERYSYRGHHMLIENAVREKVPGNARDQFAGSGDGQPKIHLLFVGRLDHQKGFDILTDAFCQVADDRPDIVLHVVGEGVSGDMHVKECPENIIMHGWVEEGEIDSWYHSAHALIVPSRWEAFGLVVAEAFRNERPALVSDRGALPFVVEDGQTGLVFPLQASAIADLLRGLDRDSLQAMGLACRTAYEKRFSFQRFEGDVLAIIERLAIRRKDASNDGSLA